MKKNKKKKNIDYQARRERIENAKTIGLSLFSNQRAIDAGLHNPWWAALIVFILAVFIPIIPMLSQGMTSAGSDMMANRNYNFDVNGARFLNELAEKDVVMTVDNGKLLDTNNKWAVTFNQGGKENALLQYNHVLENPDNQPGEIFKQEYDVLAYFTTYKDDAYDKFKEDILNRKYIKDTINLFNKDTDKADTKTYTPSTIIIMSHEKFEIMFNDSNSKYIAGMSGDYLNCENGFKLTDLLLVNDKLADITNKKDVDGVLTNWKNFFDDAYLQTRNYSTMVACLTAEGIYIGLAIFMGLMIFLLTRGKRNINRRLNFLQCQKIQSWAMLMPAILGMIMGFIIPNGAIMFFIIFLGVRIMWMSMKQLRPVIR